MPASNIKTVIYGTMTGLIAASMIIFPNIAVNASLDGLKMWWNVVFPALLPFFIITELMIEFGFVKLIGRLLEPLMRPVFKVPGAGGFVLIMGLVSGFPAGAKYTARLYESGVLSYNEAVRLSCFTNFSSPLFMFGAVAVGFLGHPAAGAILALAHYGGNLMIGVVMRFYNPAKTANLISERKTAEIAQKQKQTEPLGALLGEAVRTSVQTLMMIGGFIILFSVLNALLEKINLTQAAGHLAIPVLLLLHLDPSTSNGLIAGIFEMTNGTQRIASAADMLKDAVIAISFLLGFSGFSIQAQVAGILAEVGLTVKPFIICRLLHGIFASLFSALLLKWRQVADTAAFPVNGPGIAAGHTPLIHLAETLINVLERTGPLITLCILIFYILITCVRRLIH